MPKNKRENILRFLHKFNNKCIELKNMKDAEISYQSFLQSKDKHVDAKYEYYSMWKTVTTTYYFLSFDYKYYCDLVLKDFNEKIIHHKFSDRYDSKLISYLKNFMYTKIKILKE